MIKEWIKKPLIKICLKIAGIIYIVESAIMLAFTLIPGETHWYSELLIDASALSAISIPLIYHFVIAPFIKERMEIEKTLRAAQVQILQAQSEVEKYMRNQTDLLQDAVKRATHELQESEERYKLAAIGANDGLWDWNYLDSRIYYSQRWKEIIGHGDDEISDSPEEWFNRVHPEDAHKFNKMIEDSKISKSTDHFECEYRIRHKNETYIWVLSRWAALKDSAGLPLRLVGSQTDVNERKRMEQQLLYDALHDGLTKLPNRTLLMDRIAQSLLRLERHTNDKFALLVMDVDNFKRINDTLGHNAGDDLLLETAKRLKEVSRSVDTVARLGGDEFAIILNGLASTEDMKNCIDRIWATLTIPMNINGQEITPSFSMGVTLVESNSNYEGPEEIHRDADLSLYRAKSRGKSQYAIFDQAMRQDISKQFEIGNQLRGALERNEIFMNYQPIVNIKTNEVEGFEALMRWKHPRHGLVSPEYFIPLAEESNLILDLGYFGLQTACKQLVAWQQKFRMPKLFMSVNVSGRQLEHDVFLSQLDQVLAESEIEPKYLKIEVTENMLITKADRCDWVLKEIKSKGVCLAIDDFGIGYSSLSTLHQFPFDTLKVDRSFVKALDNNNKSSSMIKLIDLLAVSLHMKTVVEGVETQEQLDFIKELNCQYVQGYYFSKPQLAADIETYLSSNTLVNKAS